MIKSIITNGKGSKQTALVTDDSSLLVSNQTYPPFEEQKIKPFRDYLRTAAGVYDMKVAANISSPVDFVINADIENDRYISTISFIIADVSASLNEFGDITPLSNGCQLFYESMSYGIVYFHDSLKSNWDFVRFALGRPAFGATIDTFRASNITLGGAEAYIPIIDMTVFMPPYGLKLDAGTTQRLVFRIRDTTNPIDQFDAIAYGFERFK